MKSIFAVALILIANSILFAQGGPMAAYPGGPTEDLPKELAVQGEVNIPWDLMPTLENIEMAAPDKATHIDK